MVPVGNVEVDVLPVGCVCPIVPVPVAVDSGTVRLPLKG